MKLEQIGFYTLSDKRALTSSDTSPLWRCELILTDKCNFKCPYCRGLQSDIQGTLSKEQATKIVNLWIEQGLKNIRFSGGEPGLYPHIKDLIKLCKSANVEHIAISTNGSLRTSYYEELIHLGVNDFSISLDSGCCAIGDQLAGNIKGAWTKVTNNIRKLCKQTYITVGMVFTEQTVNRCVEDVLFADSLGVADIRVIPAAQFTNALKKLKDLPAHILSKYPILNYRVQNQLHNRPIRGICAHDCHKCRLVLDDMAVAKNYHFPCIIYMREGGKPIGKVGSSMRQDRKEWMLEHSPKNDPICSKMCLDVCVDFNKKAVERLI